MRDEDEKIQLVEPLEDETLQHLFSGDDDDAKSSKFYQQVGDLQYGM